jgi:hypothetical protein
MTQGIEPHSQIVSGFASSIALLADLTTENRALQRKKRLKLAVGGDPTLKRVAFFVPRPVLHFRCI